MPREPPAVPPIPAPGHQRVVPEAHNLPRKVGTEGPAEAATDDPARGLRAEVVGGGIGGVDPGAADAAAALEDDDVVALTAELVGGGGGEGVAGGDGPHHGEELCLIYCSMIM